jgi:hypothetical protein
MNFFKSAFMRKGPFRFEVMSLIDKKRKLWTNNVCINTEINDIDDRGIINLSLVSDNRI